MGKIQERMAAYDNISKVLELMRKKKAPVKSQRKLDKKPKKLDVEKFLSKDRPKTVLDEKINSRRIKQALEAEYQRVQGKTNNKAAEALKKLVTKSTETNIQEQLALEKAKEKEKKTDITKLLEYFENKESPEQLLKRTPEYVAADAPTKKEMIKLVKLRHPRDLAEQKALINAFVKSKPEEKRVLLDFVEERIPKKLSKAEQKRKDKEDAEEQALEDNRKLIEQQPAKKEAAIAKSQKQSSKVEQRAQQKALKEETRKFNEAYPEALREYKESGRAQKKAAEEAATDAVSEAIAQATRPNMAFIGQELLIKRGQREAKEAKEAVQLQERLMRSKPIVIPDADIVDAERVDTETKKRENVFNIKRNRAEKLGSEQNKPVARAKPNFDDMSATEIKKFATDNNIEIPRKRGAYSTKDLRTIMNKMYE